MDRGCKGGFVRGGLHIVVGRRCFINRALLPGSAASSDAWLCREVPIVDWGVRNGEMEMSYCGRLMWL